MMGEDRMDRRFESALPMSRLEQQLKTVWLQRPDVQGRVLSSDEMSAYIAWMARQYGAQAAVTAEDLPIRTPSAKLAVVAENLLSDPQNCADVPGLSASYGAQSEDLFFSAEQDIAVSRQLRYMPSHWHSSDYFEIYYTVRGECPICFRDETIKAVPGTVVVAAPGVVHASRCETDESILFYYLVRTSTFQEVFWNRLPSDSLMADFFRRALNGGSPTAYLHFETGDDADIARLLGRVYEEHERHDTYKRQMLNVLMSEFFVLLLRRCESGVRLPRTKDFYWTHRYSAILSCIQSNYASLTLDDLSERFHYSPRQISRIVRSCVGLSYHELILKLRMEHAASLLTGGRLSIDAVAQRVGYGTKSSFYRAFTSYYGKTPAEYKSRAGEGEA
jgi:AraC-like DNA-binding protein/mannose-6-phosphate isomerase-like protein (cupin superfamily)